MLAAFVRIEVIDDIVLSLFRLPLIIDVSYEQTCPDLWLGFNFTLWLSIVLRFAHVVIDPEIFEFEILDYFKVNFLNFVRKFYKTLRTVFKMSKISKIVKMVFF